MKSKTDKVPETINSLKKIKKIEVPVVAEEQKPEPVIETVVAAEPRSVGRPKTQTKEITKSSQIGTKENEVRATFIVNEELLERLKAIAYWDRVLIKELINKTISDYLAGYEKKNGKIKPIPQKKDL